MAALLRMLKAKTPTPGSQVPSTRHWCTPAVRGLRSGGSLTQETLDALLSSPDDAGQHPLMVWMAHHADLPPPHSLLDSAHGKERDTIARSAAEVVLGRIPDDLLLRLLGQQDALGRSCLWLLFKQARPARALDKTLAVAKLEYLAARFKEQPQKRCAPYRPLLCPSLLRLQAPLHGCTSTFVLRSHQPARRSTWPSTWGCLLEASHGTRACGMGDWGPLRCTV